MAKGLQVGLLGLGVVGGGVYHALQEKAEFLAERCGQPVTLRRILVRDVDKARTVAAPLSALTTDPERVLADPEIGLVVEVLGGEEPAFTFARRALLAGKHLVTANKEMLAKHGAELLSLAAERGLRVGFEASVGGGIPIIAALQRNLVANQVVGLRGIVNGTTNYILSEMADKGRDFAAVLREAQELGYAEPDPTNDVEGFDARYKLCILCALAFGVWPRAEDVPCQGIAGLSPADFRLAWEMGYAIKLLAVGRQNGRGLEAKVWPTLTPATGMLAGVKGVFNAVQVQGDLVGEMVFYGRGAGPEPTASAVLSDVVSIARGEPTPWPVPEGVAKVVSLDETSGRFYLRLSADSAAVGASVAERLRAAGIGVAGVHFAGDGGAVAVLTEEVAYGAVARVAAGLAEADSLSASPPVLLPVLD